MRETRFGRRRDVSSTDQVGKFIDLLETFVRATILDATSDDVADRVHFLEAREALYAFVAAPDE